MTLFYGIVLTIPMPRQGKCFTQPERDDERVRSFFFFLSPTFVRQDSFSAAELRLMQ